MELPTTPTTMVSTIVRWPNCNRDQDLKYGKLNKLMVCTRIKRFYPAIVHGSEAAVPTNLFVSTLFLSSRYIFK